MSIIDNIEDPALKAEVIQLNLTVPDPQSVLDPAIGDYHPQLYYKLACMEAYTYQNSQSMAEDPGSEPAGFEQYEPFWTPYNAALMEYVTHTAIPRQQLKDFFIGFFCFISVHMGRGLGDPNLVSECNAKTLFNMGGYNDTVAAWSLDYFDDFVPAPMLPVGGAGGDGGGGGAEEPAEDTAERLTAEPNVVGTLWSTDASKVSALTGRFADVVSDAGMQAAFSNPTEPAASLTPQQVWDMIFTDLNWMWYITTFNSDVVVPDRPE